MVNVDFEIIQIYPAAFNGVKKKNISISKGFWTHQRILLPFSFNL